MSGSLIVECICNFLSTWMLSDDLCKAVPNAISVWVAASSQFMLLGESDAFASNDVF